MPRPYACLWAGPPIPIRRDKHVARSPHDPTLHGEPFQRTIAAVGVVSLGGRHYLITRDSDACVLFASNDSTTVAWIDFAMELLAGLIALATGITLGRQGYRALRPLVDDLWDDAGFRERLERTGKRAAQDDVLSLGWSVMALWLYVWRVHRDALLRAVWRALGEVIGPRALLMALLRWAARLVGGGVTLALEIGALALPLGRKLRGIA
jgi:hypothetical protein